ncbi:MAG: hypothetical protein ACRBI6_03210 [Acidimicrobiales bacterium]
MEYESTPPSQEAPQPLPTMRDLDDLAAELDAVDRTLADLDAPASGSTDAPASDA